MQLRHTLVIFFILFYSSMVCHIIDKHRHFAKINLFVSSSFRSSFVFLIVICDQCHWEVVALLSTLSFMTELKYFEFWFSIFSKNISYIFLRPFQYFIPVRSVN